jgi:hypothetical protein
VNEFLSARGGPDLIFLAIDREATMTRLAAVLLAGVLLAGCTLDGVKKAAPPPASNVAWPAAPRGWHQSGTMTVHGQVVPVYTEDYQGEGGSGKMALNPDTGRLQAFRHDEVGNVIWKRDPMAP